jgi:HTH-type transcriptional regulator/antitoxin HipB
MAADRKTGAEKYLASRMKDAAYRAAYNAAKRRIAQVDALVQALDERREQLGLTKAELARRAELAPEAVRRLFSVDAPNPTISTLIALADALDLEVMPRPRRTTSPTKQSPAKEPARTRRRG